MACLVVGGRSDSEAKEYCDALMENLVGFSYSEAVETVSAYAAIGRNINVDQWIAENNQLDGQTAYYVIFGWLDENNTFTDVELAYEIPQ